MAKAKKPKAKNPKEVALARVRAFCLALPDVTEKSSHGAPTFFYKKRCLAYFLDNHHDDGRLALWCAAPIGAQAMLVDANPDVYFVPPYVGPSGWVGVRLDRDAAWPEIASILEAGHGKLSEKKAVRRR